MELQSEMEGAGGQNLGPHEQHDGIEIYDEPDDMDEKSMQLDPHYSQYVTEEGDYIEGDDDMIDDDFMDKISSSPSIDDGTFGFISS